MKEISQKLTCPHCRLSPRGAAHRFGYFHRKNRRTKIQRYRCRACKRCFSEATFLAEYRQKKRRVNLPLFHALTSGTGLRQAGRILRINYKTVVRRLSYYERVASTYNEKLLVRITPTSGLSHIHFDDMETSEHTKLKPLSIPMTVEATSRFLIAFDVVSMPAKGHLAETSRRKYGKRPDHRQKGWRSVLSRTAVFTAKDLKVTSDQNPFYPIMIKRYIPHAVHVRTKGRAACVAGLGEMKIGGKDLLFAFHHTAAMSRAHVNRLFRRTWCTTKRKDRLVTHLKMYQLWHNEKILSEIESRKPILPF